MLVDNASFKLSKIFLNNILDNTFGTAIEKYSSNNVYLGLGIEFDENTFIFTKEPVEKGFTILQEPIEFSLASNGVIRNKNSIAWPKAKKSWTNNDEKIKYIGLYYAFDENTDTEETEQHYELIGVLPLIPEETININEQMILNAGTIQLKLSNR